MGVMEGKTMEQLVEREEKGEEPQINGEEYLNTKEKERKLSKKDLIKQLLITIDGQSPSTTLPTLAREDSDYPAAPHLQPGTPYLIRHNQETAFSNDHDH